MSVKKKTKDNTYRRYLHSVTPKQVQTSLTKFQNIEKS